MQYVNALIGCTLVVIGLIHAFHPTPLAWAPYAGASILAFISLKPELVNNRPELSIAVARVLAIVTTAVMFFFFAGFFISVSKLPADWYADQTGWVAVCRILSAFVMIPLLSDYSCRLKKECQEARLAERRAFFSVPHHIPPHR